MSKESDETQQQLDDAMRKHGAFRRHAKEHNEALGAHHTEVANTNEQMAQVTVEAAGDDQGGPEAKTHQAEIEQLRQDRREQNMVQEGLHQDFDDLKAEFAELKKPENDVIELGRKARKLQGRDSQ